MEREIKKCLTFVKLQIASKILGKIILKPFVIFEKTQVSGWDDRTDTNFMAPLRMHF